MSAMDEGRHATMVGGGSAIKWMAEAAERPQAGKTTDYPELFAFKA